MKQFKKILILEAAFKTETRPYGAVLKILGSNSKKNVDVLEKAARKWCEGEGSMPESMCRFRWMEDMAKDEVNLKVME